MKPRPDPYPVSKFVESLEPNTRVIWIATGVKGTVQPDKAILWDDGSRMTPDRMTESHSVLIHREPEWLRVHDALAGMLACIKRGCTLDHWNQSDCMNNLPENRCPLAVLGESEQPPAIDKQRSAASSMSSITPTRHHRPPA